MENPLNAQIMTLVVTSIALAVAGVVFADMYAHGLISAIPRDMTALTVFAVIRWMLARSMRTEPEEPEDE